METPDSPERKRAILEYGTLVEFLSPYTIENNHYQPLTARLKLNYRNLLLCTCFSLSQIYGSPILDSPVIISLGRHMERYEETLRLMELAGFTHVRRFEAIDGATTDEAFFHNLNNYDERLGRRGCAASHLILWKNIDTDYLFVCEDDMLPHSKFAELFPLYWEATPKDFDLVMVGSKLKEKVGDELIVSVPAITTHAYIISRKGAQILFEEYAKIPKGSHQGDYVIDNFIARMMAEKKITYYCYNGKKYPDLINEKKIRKNFSSGICYQNLDFDSTIAKKGVVTRFYDWVKEKL